jgi:HEPN domain-containing protein
VTTDLSWPFKRPGEGVTIPFGEKAKEIARWIRWGDSDYLAARLLFMINLILQATTLSTTAIEKYVKAVCCFYNVKVPRGAKGHDVREIYSAIKAASTNKLSLNEEYLSLLTKTYRARYPDDLESGFCIALSSAKMLAQLDRSVLEITARFRPDSSDPNARMALDHALQIKDPRFLDANVAIDPSKAGELFGNPSWCFEIRRYSDVMSEYIYRVASVTDDLAFSVCSLPGDAKESDTPWESIFKPWIPPTDK